MKREEVLAVTMTKAEKEAVTAAAKENGVTASAWMRMAAKEMQEKEEK